MLRVFRVLFTILAATALAACAHLPAPTAETAAANGPVILVSIDGGRADYFGRGRTPTLAALAADGVRSTGMRPSFPSLTFPNHYAIATGLRPDRHGVVDNTMEDPRKPGVRFTLSNKQVVADPDWWNEAVPLWVSAERQGVRTGTMFWPGSDVAIHGVRPSRWRPFDMAVPPEERVATLLSWLDLPTGQRPRLFTLYFDDVDEAGHLHGPASAEVDQALARVDAALARLVEGLKARGLYEAANLVVVADHGMAATSRDRVVALDDLVDLKAIHLVTSGSLTGLAPLPGRSAEVERALLGRHDHVQCWRKGELPARFAYGTNPRVPPIVCLAEVGWVVRTRQALASSGFNLGQHGYDPAAPEMAALFVAHGPAFRKGAVIGPFDNVSVYPLIARLAGVTPEPGTAGIDGVEQALNR